CEIGQLDVAGTGLLRRHAVQTAFANFESAKPLEGVGPPGAVINLAGHRLAVLAIVRDGDANLFLPGHDILNGVGEDLVEALHLAALLQALLVCLAQSIRPRQTTDVRNLDPVFTVTHFVLSFWRSRSARRSSPHLWWSWAH